MLTACRTGSTLSESRRAVVGLGRRRSSHSGAEAEESFVYPGESVSLCKKVEGHISHGWFDKRPSREPMTRDNINVFGDNAALEAG